MITNNSKSIIIECTNINLAKAFIEECREAGIAIDEEWNKYRFKVLQERPSRYNKFIILFNGSDSIMTRKVFVYIEAPSINTIRREYKDLKEYTLSTDYEKALKEIISINKNESTKESKKVEVETKPSFGVIVNKTESLKSIGSKSYYFGIYRGDECRSTAMLINCGDKVTFINLQNMNNSEIFKFDNINSAIEYLDHWEWRHFKSEVEAFKWLAFETSKNK